MKLCPELQPRIVVAYIAVTHGGNTDTYSPRFAQSFIANPPGIDVRTIIVCNGGELHPNRRKHFDGLPCEFFLRENDGGKDISGFQDVAEQYRPDFLICFGESVHFHRPGWAKRLVDAREAYGPGMYGCFSSHFVRAHLNTTGFAVDAQYLLQYPKVVNDPQRYQFEHGPGCFWQKIFHSGGRAMLVTWDGVYEPGNWRKPRAIMHRDGQDNLLVFCNHSERFAQGNPATRQLWASQSDSQFNW